MKKTTRLLALTLALGMLSSAALAEATAVPASEEAQVQSETVKENAAQEDVALATVNGENVMQSDVDSYAYQLMYSLYSQGVDITDPNVTAALQQLAMQGSIEQKLFFQKAAELGFDQLTEEELTTLQQDAQKELDSRSDQWIASNLTLAADASEEDKAAAREQAVAALTEQGYTLDAVVAFQKDNLTFDRLYADMVKDAQVTDEEVKQAFDQQVEADKQAYADASYYEMATTYYGVTPYYMPEGYRGITHILLPVDEELMKNYQGLQASLEEAQDEAEKAAEGAEAGAEATQAPDAEPTAEAPAEPEQAPVTQADVDAAYAAILASVQPTVDEIKAKLAAGTPFGDLVAEYGTDPGMTVEPTKTEGYSVHMDSIRYDPAFVQAAFSVNNIGDVSEPYVGSYGVYLACYVRDVPAGPVPFTDAIKAEITQNLLATKENQLFSETMKQWVSEAQVSYTAEGEAYLAAAKPEATEAPAATDAPAAE